MRSQNPPTPAIPKPAKVRLDGSGIEAKPSSVEVTLFGLPTIAPKFTRELTATGSVKAEMGIEKLKLSEA